MNEKSLDEYKKLSERKHHSYQIFNEIASTYDRLNHLLSFGVDIYWRQTMMKEIFQNYAPGIHSQNVLDLATGTGDLAFVLAKVPQVNKVNGVDPSAGMIQIAEEKIQKAKVKNPHSKIFSKIHFFEGNGMNLEIQDHTFDLVTISFGIRNFPDAGLGLKEIHRVLKKNGTLAIMEFSIPKNSFFRAMYFFYFRNLLPFVGNLLSKHRDAYTYLNQTVESFPYGQKFADLMIEQGFRDVQFKVLTFGIATIYLGKKL
jgi:demethylmenaquinone methyltransferase / 2-methoxy-6-polyprenyl-1,4-benzoquinol methylase